MLGRSVNVCLFTISIWGYVFIYYLANSELEAYTEQKVKKSKVRRKPESEEKDSSDFFFTSNHDSEYKKRSFEL